MVKTLHNVRVVHIYVLGWSDIALLPIFENGQIAADQVHIHYTVCLWVQFKKNRHVWQRSRQSFHFPKITGGQKIENTILFTLRWLEASEGILEDSSPPTGHKAEPQVGLYKGYHLLSDLECLKIPLKITVTKRNAHNMGQFLDVTCSSRRCGEWRALIGQQVWIMEGSDWSAGVENGGLWLVSRCGEWRALIGQQVWRMECSDWSAGVENGGLWLVIRCGEWRALIGQLVELL